MKVTSIHSDTEGWNSVHQHDSVEEAIEHFKDYGIDVNDSTECDNEGWNPCPMLIVGDTHEIVKYEENGYEY